MTRKFVNLLLIRNITKYNETTCQTKIRDHMRKQKAEEAAKKAEEAVKETEKTTT